MANSRQFVHHRLHSLLGLLPIGLFLVFHLVANYQATKGAAAYNEVIGNIDKVPFILVLEFALIYLPIFFHAVYGLYIAFQAKHNVNNYGYFRNHMFMWQRITGVITLIYISWHVWETRIQKALGAQVSFDMMHDILANPAMRIFYGVGIVAAVFHFSNGIWSFLVHWGITVGPRSQRIAAYFTVGVFVVVSFIGLRALSAFV
ncbi:succinate dehydrogenase cytochrome b558 subunit [Brevibacillus ginsengisoli]|uniref:succinate dehydrogenase cytochrome b558 subunit n=1 Tax=Brevibacillus ginsengisoli TaxID=363854 RepID=UPI003CEC59BC